PTTSTSTRTGRSSVSRSATGSAVCPRAGGHRFHLTGPAAHDSLHASRAGFAIVGLDPIRGASTTVKSRQILSLLCLGTAAAGASPATTPRIVAAANAFLATLSDAQRSALLFAPGDTAQKQRWSNLPAGIFKRAGLMWGDLKEPQRAAWL